MSRTTVDVDAPILRELKRLQRELDLSLGRLVSDLLASALAARKAEAPKAQRFSWNTTSGGLLVDPADKDALYAVLDEKPAKKHRR